MWPFKRKMNFETVARFNYELDTNEKLKNALKDLAMRSNRMERRKYITELLRLFKEEGLPLTLKELDMLLLLRQKTGQMLLQKEEQKSRGEEDGP